MQRGALGRRAGLVAATVVALVVVCTGTAAAAPSASGVTSCAPDQQVRLVAEARGVVTLTWRENGTVAHTQSYGLQMMYGVLELDTMAQYVSWTWDARPDGNGIAGDVASARGVCT